MPGKFNIKAGHILIAEPYLMENPFKRSVVLICEHRHDGTVGFILNKTIDMQIDDLVADFPEFESMVYYGGPVATDTIHYIHNLGDLLEESTEISKGVFWGGNWEKLKFLVKSDMVKPSNIKFFVGYSGWSEGQLDGETEEGTWILDEMYPNYAFKEEGQGLWSKVLNNKGEHYTVIAQMKDIQSLN